MGGLVLPVSGSVYLDANAFIYSVERIDPYYNMLESLWQATRNNQFVVITSELTLLEVLVKPFKNKDFALVTDFYATLQGSLEVQMFSITPNVLETASQLRADFNLKTPDALHAATALLYSCTLFVTNDKSFHNVPHLPVTILSEIAF